MLALRRVSHWTKQAHRSLAARVICPPEDGDQTNGNGGGGRPENLAAPQINSTVQAAINDQINSEISAGYTYLSMSYFFAKSSVGLMGFSNLYLTMSNEELEHASALAKYLLKRNGSVDLGPIRKPTSCSWSNIGTTFNETVRMENGVSESLSQLYRLAERHNDPVTADFIATEFLAEQIESIRAINLLIARWRSLEKAPNGVYLMNRELERGAAKS